MIFRKYVIYVIIIIVIINFILFFYYSRPQDYMNKCCSNPSIINRFWVYLPPCVKQYVKKCLHFITIWKDKIENVKLRTFHWHLTLIQCHYQMQPSEANGTMSVSFAPLKQVPNCDGYFSSYTIFLSKSMPFDDQVVPINMKVNQRI